MHRGQSLYLDLLRLASALEVMAFHLAGLPNTGIEKGYWNSLGHEAVTIFFVLSGFVIPYAARSREPDPRGFAVARLTRIYSVALPCLGLTIAFDWIGHRIDPTLYQGLSPSGSIWFRLAMGATMLNEAWVSVQMWSNTPYWSISYEFWYYAIFATLFYLRGLHRVVATLLVMAVAGPNIVLLFPIWMVGWIAYRERASASWPKWIVWLGFLQAPVLFACYYYFDLQAFAGRLVEGALGHEVWWKHLAWSRYVLSDTLLGFSVALNLAAAKNLGPALESVLRLFARPIRWGVARSFTLYLLHQPAILVVTALIATRLLPEYRGLVITATTLAVVAIVAQATEMQRNVLKPIFLWAIDLMTGCWTGIANTLKPSQPAQIAYRGR